MKKNYSQAPTYDNFLKLLSSDQRRRIVTILYKNDLVKPLKRILEHEGTEVFEYFVKWKEFENMRKTGGTSGDPNLSCVSDSEDDEDPNEANNDPTKWTPKISGDFFQNFPEEMNILLLGKTGVGKSTFINALANYLQFGNIHQAKDNFEILIKTSFTYSDEEYKQRRIECEPTVSQEPNEVDNEKTEIGQSSTQAPKSYLITCGPPEKVKKIRIIDTPGIGDSRGIEQEKENFKKILDFIAQYDELHAICILMKSNETRMALNFRYCLNELFTHLHKSASRNILFCFTNSRQTLYKPGDVYPTLRSYLGKLQNNTKIGIPLDQSTMFCFDNESFRFLCAWREGANFKKEEITNFSSSWKITVKETFRLLKEICQLPVHRIADTIAVNNLRAAVLAITKPAAEFSTNQEIYNDFAAYLKENSLMPYNDVHREYLDQLIADAKRTEAEGGSTDRVKVLESNKEVYDTHIQAIESQNNRKKMEKTAEQINSMASILLYCEKTQDSVAVMREVQKVELISLKKEKTNKDIFIKTGGWFADKFNSRQVVTVNHKSAAHPHYLCPGMINGNGKIKQCNISKMDVGGLAIFFNLPIPKQSTKRRLFTVYEVAQCLMILEDMTIPPDVRDELCSAEYRQEVSAEVWARSYHFVMAKCKHIEGYIKRNLGLVDYIFDPPVDCAKDSTLNKAIADSSHPEEPQTSAEDMVLFPNHRIYGNLPSVNFQGAQAVPYVEDIESAIGQLSAHPDCRQILMMLPVGINKNRSSKTLNELQNAATTKKKMIIIIPQLMLYSANAWIDSYKHLHESYQQLKHQLKLKEEIRRVQLLGPPVNQPLQPGSPWNLLGERLLQLTPHGILSTIQLGALFETIKTQLQQEGIPSKFDVIRIRKPLSIPPNQQKNNQDRRGGHQQQGQLHGNPPREQFYGQMQQGTVNGHLQQGPILRYPSHAPHYGYLQQGQLHIPQPSSIIQVPSHSGQFQRLPGTFRPLPQGGHRGSPRSRPTPHRIRNPYI